MKTFKYQHIREFAAVKTRNQAVLREWADRKAAWEKQHRDLQRITIAAAVLLATLGAFLIFCWSRS